ncbi:aspartate/glutamate racemase family protein [Ruminococcaceae bacterium OttesenSCG-928-D13]|nr:aspartate/glutamate racemase family protein [Ruminococcaceae bacterium OttesenSCG-928-D13]
MKIKIINPNTTAAMTDSIWQAAVGAARPGTEILCVSPATGPASIECYVDDYLAVQGVIAEVLKGEREEGADAYVIACFGDPGLQAARELTDKPVLGIAEAAMAMATVLAPSFSVVSVLDRSVKVTQDLVLAYGKERFCRSVRATGLGVLEFADREKGMRALEAQSRLAVEQDGAECILLGCAGFVDFMRALNESLGVPVLDGVVPAVAMAQAMVDIGLRTSKHNTWKYPEPKAFVGFEHLDINGEGV